MQNAQTLPDASKTRDENILPEEVVTGRRLVNREEEFVITKPPTTDNSKAASIIEDEHRTCVVCVKEFADGETTVFLEADDGYAHADCLDKSEEPEAAAVLSEAEMVLQSEGGRDDYWMLVEELPRYETELRADSQSTREYLTELPRVTLHYLADVKKAAQDAKLFGRRHFLCRIYKRGQGAVKDGTFRRTMFISEPSAADPPPAASAGTPALSPDALAKDYIRQTASFVEDLRKITGTNRQSNEQPPPPPDPFGDMGKNLVLSLTQKALDNAMNPQQGTGTVGGTEREPTTAETTITFLRELGIAEIFKMGMQNIGLPLLAHSIRSRMAAAQAGGAPPNSAPPPLQQFVGAPTVNAPPQESGAGIPQPGEPGNGRTDAGLGSGFQPPTVQGGLSGLSPETAQLAVEAVLRPVVDAMMDDVAAGSGQDDYSYNVGASVEAIITVMPFSDELEPFIRATILPKSGVQLLVWLGEVNPEWVLLQRGSDATDYTGWLNELRLDLRDALSSEASTQESEDVARETSVELGDLEVVTGGRGAPLLETENSKLETANAGTPTVQASLQQSEPPAVVGGPVLGGPKPKVQSPKPKKAAK